MSMSISLRLTLNAEGDHVMMRKLELVLILRAGRPESQIHVDFVKVGDDGSLVFLDLPFGAGRNCSNFTPEQPFEIMEVIVQPLFVFVKTLL